ncbi:hypothetical protein FRC11_010834 [Ceratobasidium sp. 423]|nr:hypothetical protein FRC11_010834 [Ceratobasidium sp. 423]
MAQYTVKHRKGRSMRQKAQLRMARQQHSQPECKNTGTLLPSTQSDVLALPHVITNVVLAQKNKAMDELKKKLKNAKQREKRVKINIIKLENRAEESYLQLSVAFQATSDAKAALQSAKFQAGTDTKEIARLNNRVNILEEKILQISYHLLCATKEIKMQEKRALDLKYHWISANRTRDALRKKIKCIQSPNPTGANTQVQEYYLKDPGIIQPVVRDMLRKLACKSIAMEWVSDVINIIAEGLGVGIIGTHNTRVMWQDNHTNGWVKATLTDADERWVRKGARQLDSSGAEKKLQDAMDSALEDRAAAGRDRESKALACRSNKEIKLASVKLLEDATYEKIASM